MSAEGDASLINIPEPQDKVTQRRFAAARTADNGERGARGYIYRNAVDDLALVIGEIHILYGNIRLCGRDLLAVYVHDGQVHRRLDLVDAVCRHAQQRGHIAARIEVVEHHKGGDAGDERRKQRHGKLRVKPNRYRDDRHARKFDGDTLQCHERDIVLFERVIDVPVLFNGGSYFFIGLARQFFRLVCKNIGNLGNGEIEKMVTRLKSIDQKAVENHVNGAVWAFDYDKMFCVLMENEICRKVCEKNKYNSWMKLIGQYCISMA